MTRQELFEAGTIGCWVKHVGKQYSTSATNEIGMIVAADLWDIERERFLVQYRDMLEVPYAHMAWQDLDELELVRKADPKELMTLFGDLRSRQKAYCDEHRKEIERGTMVIFGEEY